MRLEIENAKIILNRQKSGRCELETVRDGNGFAASPEGASIRLELEEKGDCVLGRLSLSLGNESCRENDNLALTDPVTLCLETDPKPVRMTALYLHRDWWTRPAFVTKWEELPERTQCIYLE